MFANITMEQVMSFTEVPEENYLSYLENEDGILQLGSQKHDVALCVSLKQFRTFFCMTRLGFNYPPIIASVRSKPSIWTLDER